MTIYLSGAHYSGKSTTAAEIARKTGGRCLDWSRPGFVANQFWGCRPNEILPDDRTTFQWLGLIEQMKAEALFEQEQNWHQQESSTPVSKATGSPTTHENSNALEYWTIDRTTIDFLAYDRLYGDGDPVYQDVVSRYARNQYKDQKIFLMRPLPGDPEDDGKRFLDPPDRLHDEMGLCYHELGLQVVVVPVMPLADRVDFILKEVQK